MAFKKYIGQLGEDIVHMATNFLYDLKNFMFIGYMGCQRGASSLHECII